MKSECVDVSEPWSFLGLYVDDIFLSVAKLADRAIDESRIGRLEMGA